MIGQQICLLNYWSMKKNASGEDHPYYAIALGNLASVYTKLDKYSQSEEYYDQALEITKDALGASSSDYALLLKEKALLYKKIGKYAEAQRLLQRTVDIQKEVLGSHHPEYAKALYNLGNIYMIIEDVDQAEPILSEALRIREKELGKYHPNYAQSTRKMAVLNWKRKNYAETENYYKKTFDNYFHQIENYFPTMSEAEKAKFYNTKLKPTFEEFNSYSVTRSSQNPDLISKMYNYQLATKALIMYATSKVRESIINSGDSALIQKYNQWLSEKEQLSKYYSLTLQELEERNINLEELVAHANKLEKELSGASQQFASTFSKKKVDWKDVRNQLKPGEAAIEVIRFRKFLPDSSGYFSDDVYYAALIVKSDTRDHPELALIGNGKTLETRYLANYRNAIRFKIKEQFSYKLYWEPIGEKLEGINKIYFSPDGVYNQISIATFHNPATGNYLVDEITIQLLSNTKDLVAYNTPKQGSGQTILMGFPNYNKGVDKSAFKKEDDQEKETRGTRGTRGMTRGSGLSRGMRGGSLSRGLRGGLQRLMRDGESISMLPGTKREVEYLAELYSARNAKFDTLLLDNALEETIKSIKNPQTLHIATHGFFIEDVEPAEGEEEENTYIENPLLRSGLILAGANKLLTPVPALEGEEDGILTAYEAMNLNLDQTQLVVLSACETGLGEVTNGEGVYGLQRAFLVAGAKSIIMSMWSVDDDATQELMNLFYEDWLRTGEKLDAFRRAQQKLKKKYKDPFYWGAFVMIGT